jgi:hypothetical protein
MFMIDAPDLPLQQTIVVAQASQVASAPKSNRYAMGICMPVPFVDPANPGAYDSGVGFSLVRMAEDYFRMYHPGLEISEPSEDDAVVITAPKLGKVVTWRDKNGLHPTFAYEPNPGYEGNDKLVFEINTSRGPVRLVYMLKVSKVDIERGAGKLLCKKTDEFWKISSSGSEFEISDLDTKRRAAALSSLLAFGSSPRVGVASRLLPIHSANLVSPPQT